MITVRVSQGLIVIDIIRRDYILTHKSLLITLASSR